MKVLVWDKKLKKFLGTITFVEGVTIKDLPNPDKYNLVYLEL